MDHIWPSGQPPVAADVNLPPRIETPNLTKGVKANHPTKIHKGGDQRAWHIRLTVDHSIP